MRPASTIILLTAVAAGSAAAQTAPPTLTPPVGAAPAPNTAPPVSPILTNPALAPRAPAAAAPRSGLSPLDQQQMQSYRSDLQSQQRALEQQGVSPASPSYREIQQQLNRPGQ